jgi:hypothetical protein
VVPPLALGGGDAVALAVEDRLGEGELVAPLRVGEESLDTEAAGEALPVRDGERVGGGEPECEPL